MFLVTMRIFPIITNMYREIKNEFMSKKTKEHQITKIIFIGIVLNIFNVLWATYFEHKEIGMSFAFMLALIFLLLSIYFYEKKSYMIGELDSEQSDIIRWVVCKCMDDAISITETKKLDALQEYTGEKICILIIHVTWKPYFKGLTKFFGYITYVGDEFGIPRGNKADLISLSSIECAINSYKKTGFRSEFTLETIDKDLLLLSLGEG